MTQITPDILLQAYAAGIFPMAETASSPTLHWIDPPERGVMPLRAFHVPRSLVKTLRKQPFEIRTDTSFPQVMAQCAAATDVRRDTWINDRLFRLYTTLASRGNAHSVECWRDGELVGGLYGVHLGAAFFGESMFSRVTDASKVALVYLVARLNAGGFKLLDTQFITDHLARFGTISIPKFEYHVLLQEAVAAQADFHALSANAPVEQILELARGAED